MSAICGLEIIGKICSIVTWINHHQAEDIETQGETCAIQVKGT